MPTDVLMPQLSPTMTEGRLANWLKKEGDKVEVGTIIAEVETDKATMEVEAIEDGVLAKFFAKPGTDIPVGTPIAVITEEGEKLPGDYAPKSAAPAAQEPAKEEAKPAPKQEEKPAKEAAPKSAAPAPEIKPAPAPAAAASDDVKASPLARKLAAEWGVPLSAIEGSGPHGRIIRRDVEDAYQRGVRAPASGAVATQNYAPSLQDELVPHSKMRQVIAQRLVDSKQKVPHFYLTVDVQMDNLLQARQQMNDQAPQVDGKPVWKLTVNDMVIKACAMALRKFPNANASWTDEGLQKHGSVDVAVAVAMEGGLITPILRHADQKPMSALSTEMKDLAGKARAGKLQPEQYQGGTFSVSNLGMYGIKHFDAIINPPQSAILACGASEKRVLVDENDDLYVASVMTITMSVDHRVIDGALGAELLGAIKGYLENPVTMLV